MRARGVDERGVEAGDGCSKGGGWWWRRLRVGKMLICKENYLRRYPNSGSAARGLLGESGFESAMRVFPSNI